MQDNIAVKYPKRIAVLEEKIKGFLADIQVYMQNRPPDSETFSMTVGNTSYHTRKEAGAALIEMCRQVGSYEAAVIGEYLGFKITAAQQFFSTKCLVHMKGCEDHSSEASPDPFGMIQRMDNVLEAMPAELEKLRRNLENVQQQLETARLEVAKPFEKEQELAEKSARLAELNSLLDMDKTDQNEEAGQPGNAGEQEAPESCQPDTQIQMQRSQNAAEKQGKIPQPADGKGTPGSMQVRTSVREKLAAIRERRAAEQSQNRVQKPQIKKDRAAAL